MIILDELFRVNRATEERGPRDAGRDRPVKNDHESIP